MDQRTMLVMECGKPTLFVSMMTSQCTCVGLCDQCDAQALCAGLFGDRGKSCEIHAYGFVWRRITVDLSGVAQPVAPVAGAACVANVEGYKGLYDDMLSNLQSRIASMFTFDDVKALLCPACALGVGSSLGGDRDDPKYTHFLNGVEVPCFATEWRRNRKSVEKAGGAT